MYVHVFVYRVEGEDMMTVEVGMVSLKETKTKLRRQRQLDLKSSRIARST